MASDHVNAADVLAEGMMRFLSERAGSGAFACVPDVDGGWTLTRVEHWGTAADVGWDLYRLVPIVDSESDTG